MYLDQVKIFSIQFFPETVNYYIGIRTFRLRKASLADPDLCAKCVTLSGKILQGSSCICMGSIAVGTVKKTDPLFVSLPDD
jgi:hypothetical protein